MQVKLLDYFIAPVCIQSCCEMGYLCDPIEKEEERQSTLLCFCFLELLLTLSGCFLKRGIAVDSFAIDCVLLKLSASPEST
jgi:hypothetical protein